MDKKIALTQKQYMEIGVKLFGENELDWRFICPSCGHVASAADYRDAGAPSGLGNAGAYSGAGCKYPGGRS